MNAPIAALAPGTLGAGTLRLPGRVHFGYGARAQLPRATAVHGRRVLAVVDPFLEGSALLEELIGSLTGAGLAVRVHAEVTPELPVDNLADGAEVARDHGTEVIVAVGGGSALDAAKLIALLATYDGPVGRFYGENLVPGPVLPIVAMPTTAGTGSEVTPVAVVSDPDRELKVGVSSPFLVPTVAIVDPELTLGAPSAVTAFSGIDALVHAVESFTARRFDLDWHEPLPVFTGRNVLVEQIALQSAGRLGPWLPVAVEYPDHREARHEVAMGALLGGVAFGSTGTHLCHAIQYPVGALTKTPHGLGTGLLLPYAVDLLRSDPEVSSRLALLGAALENRSAADGSAERLLDRIVEINRAIGVPATLAEIGVDRGQLPRIADLTLRSERLLRIAPIEPTREVILRLLERAHAGELRTAAGTARGSSSPSRSCPSR